MSVCRGELSLRERLLRWRMRYQEQRAFFLHHSQTPLVPSHRKGT